MSSDLVPCTFCTRFYTDPHDLEAASGSRPIPCDKERANVERSRKSKTGGLDIKVSCGNERDSKKYSFRYCQHV